jgi:hypothetical protein
MKISIKSLYLSVISALLFATFAAAQIQYPVNPNPTAFQTTPYSTSYFSVAFNGAVSTTTSRTANNQSSNTTYYSGSHGVSQGVTVRIIDHNIAVDQTSSDFYADNDTTGGTIDSRSTDVWEGHIFTYTRRLYNAPDGTQLSKRSRFIIVNAREVIFIIQICPASYEDRNEWLDFEYSLRIK